MTGLEAAKIILRRAMCVYSESLTNLKLQKLLYYSQGYHLAEYNVPLFDDEIEAWPHGPVVPAVYKEYRDFRANDLPVPAQNDVVCINKSDKDFLDNVFFLYGVFGAWQLRNMTHEESPWRDTPLRQIISKSVLRNFFSTKLSILHSDGEGLLV